MALFYCYYDYNMVQFLLSTLNFGQIQRHEQPKTASFLAMLCTQPLIMIQELSHVLWGWSLMPGIYLLKSSK